MNKNNDSFASSGFLEIAEGVDACAQTCERKIKTVLGELIFSQQEGVDYQKLVFEGSPKFKQFKTAVVTQIKLVENVIDVLRFRMAFKNNLLAFEAVINTSFGSFRLANYYNENENMRTMDDAIALFLTSNFSYDVL